MAMTKRDKAKYLYLLLARKGLLMKAIGMTNKTMTKGMTQMVKILVSSAM
jgi:hypothetical protein